MSYQRVAFAGLIPVTGAHQRAVLANSTSVAINSTLKACTVLLFSVESSNVRLKMSAGAPTLTTGILYRSGAGPYTIDGFNHTGALRFQRTTATAIVNIQGFRLPGELGSS